MNTDKFSFDAGELSLDFANTVDWHASDHPQDLLEDYGDLIAWAQAAKVVSEERAGLLRAFAQNQPLEAEAAFRRAVTLREAFYRLFVDISEQKPGQPEDLALLNEALGESFSHLQVVPIAEGFSWGWAEGSLDFDQILWPVVRSAGELLISDRLLRVRQCADDRGCGYLFLDTSRNHSRRWCSMASCGNRAKAHRHYRRRQEAN